MADEFVEAVRAGVQEGGGLKGPNQPGFSRDDWIAAYEATSAPTTADRHLYLAGLWLDAQLHDTRDLATWARARLDGIARRDLLRLHVGVVNHVVTAASAAGGARTRIRFDTGEEGGYEVEGAAAPLDLSDAVSTFVDASRYAFQEGRGAPAEGKRDPTGDAGVSESLLATSRISRMYSAFENVWNECLWNGWRLAVEDGGGPVVIPGDWSVEIARAVGDARRDTLYHQAPLWSRQVWLRLPEAERRSWWAAERVVAVERAEAGTVVLVAGCRQYNPDTPPPEFVQWMILSDGEMGFLPDEPLPRLAGLTVRQLFEAWAVLASLGELLQGTAPAVRENPLPEELLGHAPVVSQNRIEEIVRKALNVSATQAKTAVSAFVSPARARSDPWIEPLVALGDGLLTPVIAALRWPNLTRSVEHWLRKGGLDMARRGTLFEAKVRADLARDNRIAGAIVLPDAVQYANEIDLVVRLGSTFLIGEVKCTVFPAEAHDYHTYWNTLREGAEQARYRVDVISRDPKAFLDWIGVRDMDPQRCRFLPLVVTNVKAGTGHQFDGVPVVDPLVLEVFFSAGKILNWVIEGPDGVEHARERVLYRSPDEAEAAVEAYLAEPPQIQRLREWIAVETIPMVSPEVWENAPKIVYISVRVPESVAVTPHA